MQDIPRRTFVARVAAGALALPLAACRTASTAGVMTPFFIGTYTRGESRGIYRGILDLESGAVTIQGFTDGIANPSYLALSPDRAHLFAVSEVDDFAGTTGGGLVAYRIGSDGALTEVGRQPTNGPHPCYVSLDAAGRQLFVANYSGGNAAAYLFGADDTLGPASAVVQHSGSGPNEDRQGGPHAHCAVPGPEGRFVFVVDLGIDKVVGYRSGGGALRFDAGAGFVAKPGAGPRHLTFHPEGRRAYLINELDSTLTALAYNPETGAMREVVTVSTLPEGHSDPGNTTADVHVHPSGRWVYGSNRGHDSIAVFAADGLALLQHQSTLGRVPRNFAIDPSGRYLVAANQESDSLAVFAIDPEAGTLAQVGETVEVPVPVCVKFA